jgi:hypothetical protein
VFSSQNKKKNTFLETKSSFYLTGKYFPLIKYFFINKQTHKNLKNNYKKISLHQTNDA